MKENVLSKRQMLLLIAVSLLFGSLLACIIHPLIPPKLPEHGIIGVEYIDNIIDPETRWSGGETDVEYCIEICKMGEYWIVYIRGESEEYYGYAAYGIYEHTPSAREISILWENRMPKDELILLMETYGF